MCNDLKQDFFGCKLVLSVNFCVNWKTWKETNSVKTCKKLN